MLSTRYVMRPLTPHGNNSDGLIKKISTDSQQCGRHCNKKKNSTVLTAFSFLFRGKYRHLICFVSTTSLAKIFHVCFTLLRS